MLATMFKTVALGGLVVFLGAAMARTAFSQDAARFTFGQTRLLAAKDIGPEGGRMTIQGTDTPLEGLVLDIPPGALEREDRVTIGYDDGTLILPMGAPSGKTAVITFGKAPSLALPAAVSLPFDRDKAVGPPQGYAVDAQGRLDLLMLARFDRESGVAVYHTFRSMTMTWAYLDMRP